MTNYDFCARWVVDRRSTHRPRVLDYGCGAGDIVKLLRNAEIDAFGCDVFYEGGDYSKQVKGDLVEQNIIKRMAIDANGIYRIPFDDHSFDFIVTNQVLEHVVNLDDTLNEIARVLKPGGELLSLFPDKGVWREGHCGIAFLHWFPKGSTPRIYFAALFRSLGLGYHKAGKGVMQWSRDFCTWLDNWTYYRSGAEIDATYAKHFTHNERLEHVWLQQRLGARKAIIAWMPRYFQGFIVRKLACLVFSAKKSA
jgi:SAM-dependent methyltransferase